MPRHSLTFMLFALPLSLGFSASSMMKKRQIGGLAATVAIFSEQEATICLTKAKECAFSDSCPVEEAREHLHDVLHIQGACAGGILLGHDLCEDQDVAAEIVANLRQKIKEGNDCSVSLFAGQTFAPVTVVLIALTMAVVNYNPDVTPFTMEEVGWAVRDGYVDDLVFHWLRNGGL